MPKIIPPLTDTIVRKSLPSGKARRLFDGKETGLHLLIQPTGVKLWRYRYKINGKEKRITLGSYPDVSLEIARKKAGEIRELIDGGGDPSAPPVKSSGAFTFGDIAEKFIKWKTEIIKRSDQTIKKYRGRLESDLRPLLLRDITTLAAQDVIPIIEDVFKRSPSQAKKCLELAGSIIRFAVQRGYRPPHTQIDLSCVVPKTATRKKKIPSDVAATIRKIDNCDSIITRYAIKLQFLFFLRSSEIMSAEWSDFDLERREWLIPGYRMKMKIPHVVPLSDQAMTLLKELHGITGEMTYLFPSPCKEQSMCRDSLSKAFRELDLGIVPHGCRTLASTWLKNNKVQPHLVETQLAHAQKDEVEAAYEDQPHLLYLGERHPMMQKWADYIMPNCR